MNKQFKSLFINGNRNGYTPKQCGRTFSIRELIDLLEDYAESYGDDAPVYLVNDNGYTFGSINEDDIGQYEEEEEDE